MWEQSKLLWHADVLEPFLHYRKQASTPKSTQIAAVLVSRDHSPLPRWPASAVEKRRSVSRHIHKATTGMSTDMTGTRAATTNTYLLFGQISDRLNPRNIECVLVKVGHHGEFPIGRSNIHTMSHGLDKT